MAEKLSTSMCQLLLGGTVAAGGSLRSIVNGNFKLYIYGGTVPATADLVPGGTLLATLANAGAAVNMAADPVGGVLAKLSSETWSGTVSNGGAINATFYRFCLPADIAANVADAGAGAQPRIQGTIGVGGADMNVGTVALADASTFTCNYFTQAIVPS